MWQVWGGDANERKASWRLAPPIQLVPSTPLLANWVGVRTLRKNTHPLFDHLGECNMGAVAFRWPHCHLRYIGCTLCARVYEEIYTWVTYWLKWIEYVCPVLYSLIRLIILNSLGTRDKKLWRQWQFLCEMLKHINETNRFPPRSDCLVDTTIILHTGLSGRL